MMYNTLRLFLLLLSIILASQGIFYMLGAYKALGSVSMDVFAAQRKALDLAIAGNLKVLYLSALTLGVIILGCFWKKFATFEYISIGIAFLFILADVLLATKENIPINQLFYHYPTELNGINWSSLRSQWLQYIIIRGTFAILAMLVLLNSWTCPRFKA